MSVLLLLPDRQHLRPQDALRRQARAVSSRSHAAPLALFVGLSLSLSLPRPAHALPQVSVAATVGGGAVDLRDQSHAAFHLGARADAIFLRSRERDLGVGPYVDIASSALRTFEFGGGIEGLLPLGPNALVLGAGLLERLGPSSGPAAEGTLFFGNRELATLHSLYALSGGVFVQGRYGFAGSRQAEVLGGLQVDPESLAPLFALSRPEASRLRRGLGGGFVGWRESGRDGLGGGEGAGVG